LSIVTVESVKRDLRIIHDDDDVLLQELIDAAEQACLQFLNISELPGLVSPDVACGIRLMVRSMYEETDPARLIALRSAAESFWMPYREQLGV